MRQKISSYISSWESRGYPQGIPDEADTRLETLCKAPSYRAICRAILRNDAALVSLGFQRDKTPEYMAIKRLEIEARNERVRSGQGADKKDV